MPSSGASRSSSSTPTPTAGPHARWCAASTSTPSAARYAASNTTPPAPRSTSSTTCCWWATPTTWGCWPWRRDMSSTRTTTWATGPSLPKYSECRYASIPTTPPTTRAASACCKTPGSKAPRRSTSTPTARASTLWRARPRPARSTSTAGWPTSATPSSRSSSWATR